MAKTVELTGESNIVVTGKSGAGKQPRIDVLVQDFGLRQLSTGNIFRHYLGLFDAIGYPHALEGFRPGESGNFLPDGEIEAALDAFLAAAQGDAASDVRDLVLGLKAKYYVERGLFVPDGLVNDLLKASFARNGFKGTVLDGYPRTANQAEYLMNLMRDVGGRIDLVLVVDNDDDLIIARTLGRRICPSCGKVFHVEFKPPGPDGACTACGTEVVLRSDDSEQKIKRRLDEFRMKCLPAIGFMKRAGIPVAHVNGNLEVFTVENVRRSVLEAVAGAE